MTDSLGDILARRKMPEEKPEVKQIKAYVQDVFDEPCNVSVREHGIVIEVSDASLASALREHLHVLKEELQTKKSLRISIRG